eukprot:2529723-Pleurochrysis_carterae.AAC.2
MLLRGFHPQGHACARRRRCTPAATLRRKPRRTRIRTRTRRVGTSRRCRAGVEKACAAHRLHRPARAHPRLRRDEQLPATLAERAQRRAVPRRVARIHELSRSTRTAAVSCASRRVVWRRRLIKRAGRPYISFGERRVGRDRIWVAPSIDLRRSSARKISPVRISVVSRAAVDDLDAVCERLRADRRNAVEHRRSVVAPAARESQEQRAVDTATHEAAVAAIATAITTAITAAGPFELLSEDLHLGVALKVGEQEELREGGRETHRHETALREHRQHEARRQPHR